MRDKDIYILIALIIFLFLAGFIYIKQKDPGYHYPIPSLLPLPTVDPATKVIIETPSTPEASPSVRVKK